MIISTLGGRFYIKEAHKNYTIKKIINLQKFLSTSAQLIQTKTERFT